MGTKHQSSADPGSDPKRRRRVAFSKTDPGIEANECIKIYLVSSKEEVDSPNSYQIEPVDLNQFFEDDEGKIYGYQGLKITVWFSSISFHAYADISFVSSSDGGKGITDLKSSLQNIFAENLVEKKDDFLQTFSSECQYVKNVVSSAEVLQKSSTNGCSGNSDCPLTEEPSKLEVFRVRGTEAGHLYSRLVPLVLLLIDGSNPIDVTDPRWEIYTLVRNDEPNSIVLLGFAAVYRFHRYPDSMRLRLGQILITPPYQRKGYGRRLLEVLNNVAISENVYDLTVEEPEDALQHVRSCIDVQRLLAFEPIQEALSSVVSRLKHENLSKKSQPSQLGPPQSVVEAVRENLKINKKQFRQCWEILIYLNLDPIEKYMDNYMMIVTSCVKANVLGKESEGEGKRVLDIPTEFDPELSFSMFKSQGGEATGIEKEDNQTSPEEQLNQLVDERIKQIKSVAEKVSVRP